MHKLTLITLLCCIILASTLRVRDSPQTRAKALLAQMTQDEKLSLVYGIKGPYVGNTNAIPRLNIPTLNLEDGPQGVADGITKTTCWPSALTVVATWNVDTMLEWGVALGAEQRAKGTNIMLGPMINIARVPVGGRNFESFGEDPHLTSQMVAASVKGIQNSGVIACAKHFVDNNQEYHRTTVSANVPERAQWEIYYPGFQAAVDAGVGSIMCSYNRVNDTYACENKQTLTNDLKGTMGFQGFVMSDWGATHSTVNAANNGLDQQMPDNSYFGAPLAAAVAAGQVPQARIDDMVTRILTAMYAAGIMDTPQTGNLTVDSQTPGHTVLARNIAIESNVLVQNNNNLLPLNLANIKTIAVIGDDGHDQPTVAGGGSGHVIPPYVITPLQAIKARAGSNVQVTYANTSNTDVATVAANADVAIVFVATSSSEGSDRTTLGLGTTQDSLVAAVAKVQKNVVVVVHTPGASLMPWASSVDSIIVSWMPGQEDGNAITPILFGDVSPSGKLPVTFPVSDTQICVNTQSQYPGINDESAYSEELLVGYRWYDAQNQQPLFEFGLGLTYTTFAYSNPQVYGNAANGVVVTFVLANSGQTAAAEVPQLYLSYPTSAGEPPKVLRGFDKVYLNPGQSQLISFSLTAKDFSIWDVTQHNWALVSGDYTLLIGASSRDIKLKAALNI